MNSASSASSVPSDSSPLANGSGIWLLDGTEGAAGGASNPYSSSLFTLFLYSLFSYLFFSFVKDDCCCIAVLAASASLMTSGHFVKSRSSNHGTISLPVVLYHAPNSSNVIVLLGPFVVSTPRKMEAHASTMVESTADSEEDSSSIVASAFRVPKFRIAVRKDRKNFHSSRRVSAPSLSLSKDSNPMASFSLFPPVQSSEQPDANSS